MESRLSIDHVLSRRITGVRDAEQCLCLQQAPLQQCLHVTVTPPISNHKHVDVISHHSADDAVRLEEDLTVLPDPNVEQFLRGGSTLWVNMQKAIDMWDAEREHSTDYAKIQTLEIAR